MCKSSQPQSGAAAAWVPIESDHHIAKAFKVDDHGQQQEQCVLTHDESSGVIIFGSFVAGALVGVIIAAPTFVVFLLGAGGAALTYSDSKAGVFSRKVGKWSSDVLLAIFRKGREFNSKHHLTDNAKESMQQATARVSKEVQQRGIVDNVKARAKCFWAYIDERTTPACPASTTEGQAQKPSLVTDGTQLPFDGANNAFGKAPSSSEGKGLPPKSFDP